MRFSNRSLQLILALAALTICRDRRRGHGRRRGRWSNPTPRTCACCAIPTSTATRSSSATPATCGPSRAQGGQARRLTGSVGYQTQPKFSPDGQTIAFSGNYDGNNDVYTIPAGGGEPVRLTWHPGWDRVIDWQPDGKARPLPVAAARAAPAATCSSSPWPASGGLPERMILPTGGLSSYSPDGKQDRLQPHHPRAPHLETLQGRHGPGHLDLRLRRRTTPSRSPTGSAATTSPCGTATRSTTPATRPAACRSGPTTRPPASSARSPSTTNTTSSTPAWAPTPSSTRTAAGCTCWTWTPSKTRKVDASRLRSDNVLTRAAPQERRTTGSRGGDLGARRQAGRVRRPRRHLHRAGREGQRAQPDRHARHPRARARLVARRQARGLPQRPHRRVRDLASAPADGKGEESS